MQWPQLDLNKITWTDVMAAYAAVIATIVLIKDVIKGAWVAFRDRRRVSIFAALGLNSSVVPQSDGFYEVWYLNLSVTNVGRTPLKIARWGLEYKAKVGPVALPQHGLPKLLEDRSDPWTIRIDEPCVSPFLKSPSAIFIEDERGKRHYGSGKVLKRAIADARAVTEHNGKRSREMPEAMRQQLAKTQLRQVGMGGGGFGPVPPHVPNST